MRCAWLLFVCGCWLAGPLISLADESAKPSVVSLQVGDFLQAHCLECHQGSEPAGGLNLASFELADLAGERRQQWIKIHDKVAAGQMPPDSELPMEHSAAFRQTVADAITAAELNELAGEGRAVWRRLNRYEYEHTLRDLLGAPWLQLKEMLPADGQLQCFNKSGEALDVSAVHMSRYLQAADYALRQVIARHAEQPQITPQRFYAREQPVFNRKSKFSQFNRSAERATFPLLGYQADLPVLLEPDHPFTVGADQPELREQEAFGVVASSYEPLELRFDQFKAPEPGLYSLRFKGYTFWAGPSTDGKWWRANREQTSIGRRSEPVIIYSERPPRQLRRLGQFDFQIEPSVQELQVWLLEGETIRPDAVRLFRSRPPNWRNPLAEKDGMPGVAFSYLEVEGPLQDTWPPPGHQRLFGDLPWQLDTAAGSVQVVSSDPQADARRLLTRFMQQVYRRPLDPAEVLRFLGVVESTMAAGQPFSEAMLAGYTAVLCSPAFLCLEEYPGVLDDYAVASRLSYFLWNSAPDQRLRELAAEGQLHDPHVLRNQVQRMLEDERSARFVEAFLDYWLDLRRIGETSANELLYPDYYLDDALVDAALQETQLYFTEMIRANLPVRQLVDSRFTFVNERLAVHYGLPAVEGVQLRRVELPADSPRGGLLTQASVLKVTANGSITSPVVRGAWVCERILGQKPPAPPAGVPAVEPDTRGATTLRMQLELHRNQGSCQNCHALIDPPGFALENFDVLGRWQDRYRNLGEHGTPATGFGKNGQPFNFHWGEQVDASGSLDGQPFQNIHDFKKILAGRQRQLARNLVRQLLVFATGAPHRFSDRQQIEELLDIVAQEQYGVRSIIEAVATSPLFLHK